MAADEKAQIRPWERIPARDLLSGDTQADNTRHVMAREVLLSLLEEDERCVAFFDSWSEKAGLKEATVRLTLLLDELATLAGLPDRGELWERYQGTTFTVSVEDTTDAERLVELDTALTPAVEAWEAAFIRFGSRIPDELVRFVRDELGLPWPWVMFELFELYLVAVRALVSLRFPPIHSKIVTDPPPVPEVEVRLPQVPGESWDHAYHRWQLEKARIEAEFEAAAQAHQLPKGKTPNVETIEAHTRWFYRHRLCGESISSIARTAYEAMNGQSEAQADRATVRYGIERAEEALGLVPFRFREGGEDSGPADAL